MAFDGLVMAAVNRELTALLTGGRVEKIYQPLPDEILLVIHKDRNKYRLLISANSRDARVHVTRTTRENPLTPPLFCMVLRKHLEGGKIVSIHQQGLDRVLFITIEAVDELGMLSGKTLVCEVMGKHSNIILLDPAANSILDGIHRYSYGTSRHREILPGRQYVSPPPTGKINPADTSEDLFRSIVWDPDSDIPTDKLLLTKFDGLSPQTCREIVFRAGLEPTVSAQFLGEFELSRLWQAFSHIKDSLVTGSFDPCLCYRGNYPVAFSAIGLTQFPDTLCKTGSISMVVDEFYTVREKQEQFKKFAGELDKVIASEMKRSRKKLAIHQHAFENAKEAETFKIYGELITANIYRISKGEEQVELENYYDPAQQTVTIPLDQRFSPAENAQHYFKKYSKARHSQEIAAIYLDELHRELQYLESVSSAINQAERTEELGEIKAELIKEGYINPEPTPKGSKKVVSPSEPLPLTLLPEGGYKILIGRNNRQNDYLTMKLAGQDDLWFHVREIPGSHVVVKSPDTSTIPDHIIQMAAEAAAFYSKARESSKVPVDYTFRKHVRKPKGAKPGMVIYDSQTTVIVEPRAPEKEN